MLRVITSTSASARLGEVSRFLAARSSSEETLIVGASRGAADDAARGAARELKGTFGLTRVGFAELVARTAMAAAGGRIRPPGSQAGAEAVAARAVFDAVAEGELTYFSPVASMPGFPTALARTVHELRLDGVVPSRLESGGAGAADLGRLLARVEAQLDETDVDDRAALLRRAAGAWAASRWAGLRVVLLDVPLESSAEAEFVAAIVASARETLAIVPDGDTRALAALAGMGGVLEIVADAAAPGSDLAHLRTHLFASERPPLRERTGDVRLFSAPGEGREAVEIVRRVLDEAARGVRFDDMAVLLRAPGQYLGLLEHACARAGVPAYFDRGTGRPDPAGRAFVALLSCAVEGLSARRFDEYLSLGQVPRVDDPVAGEPVPPRDEVFGDHPPLDDAASEDVPQAPDSDDEAVVAGTLRSPWKWEALVVESAVVGGRSLEDGSARWRRRLDGLAADYRYRMKELGRDEPESARLSAFARDLKNLGHLREFALPIIDALAGWPERALWGEWIERMSAMANRSLRRPVRVLQTLADLRPMGRVGPISLEEARDVLRERLAKLDWDPPARRYGRLFIGTPHQARGRVFRVVFSPGLAERVVPQRPREDPLLADQQRRAIAPSLVGQEERGSAERLLLKIALGAAGERVYLSYPRLDVAESRARVPSFYALDVMRAMTGRVPDHRVLAADAGEESRATLAWPAPPDANDAIDDLEHDLAVLKPLLDARDGKSVKGHAHYLLGLNESLRRSVVSRYSRNKAAWAPSDGVVAVTPALAPALARHRLAARPYSLSALQRFAACPYQFLLATIYRLEPRTDPEPLLRMDPLTRGSLFHSVQAEFYREMDAGGALPITPASVEQAVRVLGRVMARVSQEYEEQLAPAVDRVWRTEIDAVHRDLAIWVQKLADERVWRPRYFEFSFGLNDAGRDPRSVKEPVLVAGRYLLRGSVDLIEHREDLDALRVTDHKTGKNRATPGLVLGGGSVLQPVLYSLAVEEALGKKVLSGRLYYATTAGGFVEHPIPINEHTRAQGLEALAIVDRAVERGFLAAAPAERACTWCDFRPVCGPHEEERVAKKRQQDLADLIALRALP